MQLKRTVIYVKFPHKSKQKAWLSSWLTWWKEGGFEWINHIGSTTRKPKQVDPEQARQLFLTVASDLRSQILSDKVKRAFRKDSLDLPYTFVVKNIMRAAVGRDEPEEVIVSGEGNADALVKWLEKNHYDFTVRTL